MTIQDAIREMDEALRAVVAGRGPSRCVLGAVGALAMASAVHGQTVVHVDDDAPPGGDGTSWQTAFRDLQDAIAGAAARHESYCTIKVAAGVYVPDRGTGNRNASFVLTTSGVTLMGGFVGLGGLGLGHDDPNERDPSTFVSVLSGDLDRDDDLGESHRNENSHVVVRVDGPSDLLLRDLVIRGAESPHLSGGGVQIQRGDYIYLSGCIVTDNRSGGAGGVDGSGAYELSIMDCRIEGNTGGWGAGGVWGTNVWVWRSKVRMNRSLSSYYPSEIGMRAGGQLRLDHSLVAGGVGSVTRAIIGGDGASLVVRGSTIVQPVAERSALFGTNVVIVNSIVSGGDRPCDLGGGATMSVANSCLHVVNGEQALSTGLVVRGAGVVFSSPRFVAAAGADGNVSTILDNDYRLSAGSNAIDMGNAQWLGNDSFDLDGDRDWEEPLSLDLAEVARVHEDMGTINRGTGLGGAIDLGAFEFQGVSCRGDYDGSGTIAIGDVLLFVGDWIARSADADFDRSGSTEAQDLFDFLTAFFGGCA